MKPGIDGVFIWVRIATKEPLQQPGGPDRAVLRMEGQASHEVRRGTQVTVETTHFPIEANGRLALAMDRMVANGAEIWVIGHHRDDVYADENCQMRRRLKIVVDSFEIKRTIDLRTIFED